MMIVFFIAIILGAAGYFFSRYQKNKAKALEADVADLRRKEESINGALKEERAAIKNSQAAYDKSKSDYNSKYHPTNKPADGNS